jgi:negative regulator of sigma E activity
MGNACGKPRVADCAGKDQGLALHSEDTPHEEAAFTSTVSRAAAAPPELVRQKTSVELKHADLWLHDGPVQPEEELIKSALDVRAWLKRRVRVPAAAGASRRVIILIEKYS